MSSINSLGDRLKRLQVQTARKMINFNGSKYENDKENNSLSTSVTGRQNKTAPPGALHNSTCESMVSMHAQTLNSTANDTPLVQCVEDRARDRERRQTTRERSQTTERAHALRIPPMIEERPVSSPLMKCKSMGDVNEKGIQPLSHSCSLISLNPDIITVMGKAYHKLKVIGRGGSSQVVEALDESSREVVAIKIVDLDGESREVRNAYMNEIALLRNLQGSKHVITMYDYELVDDTLYVVLEKGDTDLSTHIKTRAQKIDATFIRYFWKEMLHCVKVIHDRNILHSDLKPANFLLVKGNLKLIDFGIASSIPTNKTSVVKDVQMGTINYMSPESVKHGDDINGTFKIPLKSDVWSLGCILYTLVYGKNPFAQYKTQFHKIRAISSDDVKIEFPPLEDDSLLDTLHLCLTRDIDKRASIDELLNHPYCSDQKAQNFKLDISCAEELLKNTPRTAYRKLQKLFEEKSTSRGSSQSEGRQKNLGQMENEDIIIKLNFED